MERRARAAAILGALALAEGSGVVETLALPIRVSLGAPSLLVCLILVLASLPRDAPVPAARIDDAARASA